MDIERVKPVPNLYVSSGAEGNVQEERKPRSPGKPQLKLTGGWRLQ